METTIMFRGLGCRVGFEDPFFRCMKDSPSFCRPFLRFQREVRQSHIWVNVDLPCHAESADLGFRV